MSLERFIKLWMNPDYPPEPVSEARLEEAEEQLGARFPDDYRAEILRHGLAAPTIALLDTIVDRELDMPDLSDMLSPEEMIETNRAERDTDGPADLIAFAVDCCGNLFCFGTDGAIVYFDHDLGTSREVATGFTAWIEAFNRLRE